MKNKLTIKQYAEHLGISVAGVQQRITRGTLKKIVIDGLIYVFINTDKTKSVGRPKKIKRFKEQTMQTKLF